MARAVVLLAVLLGAYTASAYPMIWTAMTKDCSAVPQASYGPHGAPVQDSKTLVTVKRNGSPVVKICPGVMHDIKAVFPEQRQYILTTSLGGFSGTAPECPNRFFSQVAKPDMGTQLTVACDATGAVTLSLLSVGAHAKDRTYQAISLTMPIKELQHCPASPCNSQAAQQQPPQQQQQPAAGALKPESGAAAPGTKMEGAAAAGPVDANSVTLDPSMLQNGNVNVGELLARLGVTEQQLKALQGAEGAAAPAPGAAAAPQQPSEPTTKTVQVGMGDLLAPLKHMFGGGQQQQQNGADGAAAQHKDGGINPLKFLQTVANLMPKEGGAAAAPGEGQQAQNALKMLQNLAALMGPKGEGGKEGGAPILNLLQTVGQAINGNEGGASKDGLPILNVLQTLGSALGQGGKDGKGGVDAGAMLDVVKAMGTLMPTNGENATPGAGPNFHNLMNFVNAVGKALPAAAGAAPASEAAPKDIPSAAIAVLKSMGPLLPKEPSANGVPQPPNWPAMIQFVRASGNLLSLIRPPSAGKME